MQRAFGLRQKIKNDITNDSISHEDHEKNVKESASANEVVTKDDINELMNNFNLESDAEKLARVQMAFGLRQKIKNDAATEHVVPHEIEKKQD